MFVLITRKNAYLIKTSSTYVDKVPLTDPIDESTYAFEIPKVWLDLLAKEKSNTIAFNINFQRDEPNLKAVPPQDELA